MHVSIARRATTRATSSRAPSRAGASHRCGEQGADGDDSARAGRPLPRRGCHRASSAGRAGRHGRHRSLLVVAERQDRGTRLAIHGSGLAHLRRSRERRRAAPRARRGFRGDLSSRDRRQSRVRSRSVCPARESSTWSPGLDCTSGRRSSPCESRTTRPARGRRHPNGGAASRLARAPKEVGPRIRPSSARSRVPSARSKSASASATSIVLSAESARAAGRGTDSSGGCFRPHVPVVLVRRSRRYSARLNRGLERHAFSPRTRARSRRHPQRSAAVAGTATIPPGQAGVEAGTRGCGVRVNRLHPPPSLRPRSSAACTRVSSAESCRPSSPEFLAPAQPVALPSGSSDHARSRVAVR